MKAILQRVAVKRLSKDLGQTPGQAMKVLLIEDNEAMRTTLQRSLQRLGMQVTACADGARALDRWQASLPDVVLLDLSLPGMDGLQVLTAARAAGLDAPVLILTARGTVGDRILGLNSGADDYLPKPFDLDELEARVRALARRGQPAGTARQGDRPVFCGLWCDTASGAVHWQGTVMDLPPRELALLRALLARPGHAVAKEALFEQVFAGEAGVQIGAIEVVAYRLRKRIAHTGVQLVTLRGLGYLLKAEA
jgi:two-component system response regulator TctD